MADFSHRTVRYGDHVLQTVDVWEPPVAERVPAKDSNRYFFIYIHGGAWRDAQQLNDTAVPAYKLLTDPAAAYIARDRIAGFASVGYRLSPDPAHPQDPATTPANELRSVRHPDHIRDVWAALAALAQSTGSPAADYMAHDRYIVCGHSCGAFLTYQLWMGAQATGTSPPPNISPPPCVVGLEGIYDLRGLVGRGGNPAHGGGPGTGFAAALQAIAEGAFGADRAAWDAASPGRFDWASLSDDTPPRLAVLAYSPEDELVDEGEVDTMAAALQRGAQSGKLALVVLRDLRGRHDDVHERGHEVARVLAEAVRQLDGQGGVCS